MFERAYYPESRQEAKVVVYNLLDAAEDAFDPRADLDRLVPHRCPDCGGTNLSDADDEGLIDCLDCGIWFNPLHPANSPVRPQEGLEDEIPDLKAYAMSAGVKPWGYMLQGTNVHKLPSGETYKSPNEWLNARRLNFVRNIGDGTVFKRLSTTKQWPNLKAVPVYSDPRQDGEYALDPNFNRQDWLARLRASRSKKKAPRQEGLDDEIDPLAYAHATVNAAEMARELGFEYEGKNTADSRDHRDIWSKTFPSDVQMRMTVGSDPTLVNIFVYQLDQGQLRKKVSELLNITATEVRQAVRRLNTLKEGLEDEIPDLRAYTMQHGLPPRITITFSRTTPESAEEGGFSETGWKDEDGTRMVPDELDQAEGKTAVDLAVEFLWKEGATEHSSSSFDQGGWYSTGWQTINLATGEEEECNYHLEGFTPKQEEEIYTKLMARRRH